jgi:heme/copper-type cytochrome/quinol oxidase subunit 2
VDRLIQEKFVQANVFLCRAMGPVRILFAMTLLGTAALFASEHSNAQQSASVAISVKDHRFQPSQISAPANRPISIRVKNLDTTPMEFESTSLRVEKVIVPGGEGVVNVRALAPGRYEFFDDFHQETRGTLVVQ